MIDLIDLMTTSEFFARNGRDIPALTMQHLGLVLVAMLVAVAIGVPLGILVTRRPALQRPVLGFANIFQTVPSLALFGFLLPMPFLGGIGARTAIIALVLYALLPVIRATVTGIQGVDPHVREAAAAMGMTDAQILKQVELPLAMPVILSGIRVATVICVGVATIAAAIGAGGLGTYIFRGLRQNDNPLILAGAVPAALLAILADGLLGLLEKRLGEPRHSRGMAEEKGSIYSAAARGPARRGYRTLGVFGVVLLLAVYGLHYFYPADKGAVTVGSKDFTESVILAEIVAQSLEDRGVEVKREYELAGNLCHDALVAGRIDCYPEYTGTSYTAILKHKPISDVGAVYKQVRDEYLKKFNVVVSPPLGFSNGFAILVRQEAAKKYNLSKISQIAPLTPQWVAGFGQDFVSRDDGFPGFSRTYGLTFSGPPREMDLALTYRALASGKVDLIAGNETDGLISALKLVQLQDDKSYFPPYQGIILMRRATLDSVPAAAEVLQDLDNKISTDEMRALNYQVDGKKRDIPTVVREWRAKKGL